MRFCSALVQQLPGLANEVAAHAGKRGIVSHHQLEHIAYLIPQRIVNVRGYKGFAEDVQLAERLPALGQKFRAIQAVELLSSLLEALCCMVSRSHSNLLKHRIGLPDKMFFRVVDIGVEEVTTLRLSAFPWVLRTSFAVPAAPVANRRAAFQGLLDFSQERSPPSIEFGLARPIWHVA